MKKIYTPARQLNSVVVSGLRSGIVGDWATKLPLPAKNTLLKVLVTASKISTNPSIYWTGAGFCVPVNSLLSSPSLITGATVSTTVTSCVAVAVLPEESVAVHVTTVSPRGRPGGMSLLVGQGQFESRTSGVPKSTCLFGVTSPVPSTMTSRGGTNSGAVVSITFIIWMSVAVLPLVWVAVHVITFSPTGKELALLSRVNERGLPRAFGTPTFTGVSGLLGSALTTWSGGTWKLRE